MPFGNELPPRRRVLLTVDDMPELDARLIVFLVCVGLYTLTAAVWDVRCRRIPNVLTMPTFVLGLAYQGVFNGWPGVGDAALGFLVGFGTLLTLWLVGGGGGGDVKLMGALSVWLGFRNTLYVLMASIIIVAVSTLAMAFWTLFSDGLAATWRRFLSNERPTANGGKPQPLSIEQKQKRRVMAYALPVAVATWAVVLIRFSKL